MLAVAYATGRASHVRPVKGDDPDKKGYPGPPGWGLGVRLTTPTRKKHMVTKPHGNEAGRILRQGHETMHNGLRLRTRNKLELNIGIWNVRRNQEGLKG
jgi:hypothetical protein